MVKAFSVLHNPSRLWSQEAAAAMNRMAKLCKVLGNRGFSIGINDVTPADELKQKKELMVEQAYLKCDQLIDLYNRGKLETQPGCNEEQTLEAKIGGCCLKSEKRSGMFVSGVGLFKCSIDYGNLWF